MLRNGFRSVRRMATVQSSPTPPQTQSMLSSARGVWELILIGGTGTFGLYEIYKGMFMIPPHEPTTEEIAQRLDRRQDRPYQSTIIVQRVSDEDARKSDLNSKSPSDYVKCIGGECS